MAKTTAFIKDIIVPILIGLLIAFVVKTYIFSFAKVDGSSMDPNLHTGEYVPILKFEKPHHDSVIVFNASGVDPHAVGQKDFYVKRVIGMPGDKIDYKSNGELFINGKEVSQSFISKDQQQFGTLAPIDMNDGFNLKQLSAKNKWQPSQTTVPKNSYFVMGDNRQVSNDSRYWGFVPASKISGVVKLPFWDSHRDKINK